MKPSAYVLITRKRKEKLMYARNLYHSLLVALGLVSLLSTAHAEPLAPTKPSELVTIRTTFSGSPAPCDGTNVPVRTVINPDATGSTLAIPAGQVLILTGGSWRSASPVAANRTFHLVLSFQTGAAGAAVFSGAGAMSDATGEVSGSFDLGSGLVLRPGTTLCAALDSTAVSDDPALVHVYGFFDNDK